MPSLSERLKAKCPGCRFGWPLTGSDHDDHGEIDRCWLTAEERSALPVAIAVEAFQAAEQALDDVRARYEKDRSLYQVLLEVHEKWEAAKARLLEVNLE